MAPPKRKSKPSKKLQYSENKLKTLEATEKTACDLHDIKNRIRRMDVFQKRKLRGSKLRIMRRMKKKQDREELGEEAVPIEQPKTLENTREFDPTMVEGDDTEVQNEDEHDEFADYFKEKTAPKIMMTTCRRPYGRLFDFMKDLKMTIPNVFYYKRGDYPLKDVADYACNKGFTDLIVLTQKAKKPNGVVLMHLPYGPTADFKLTSLKLNSEIHNHGVPTDHDPEIILNNFDTRLGHRMGRMLAALIPQRPEFSGRRVVTFHNQRDFIFVRHHRYIFDDEGNKCRLQELGPKFTLKLRTLQHGLFDPQFGDFEWKYRSKMSTSRRRFFL
mmetsp:Transcript_36/g.38  ORF Transcript_36/g.38 Transcript_36/m.38 type:complete len:329 (+) Transcript_36:75-1061(+)